MNLSSYTCAKNLSLELVFLLDILSLQNLYCLMRTILARSVKPWIVFLATVPDTTHAIFGLSITNVLSRPSATTGNLHLEGNVYINSYFSHNHLLHSCGQKHALQLGA